MVPHAINTANTQKMPVRRPARLTGAIGVLALGGLLAIFSVHPARSDAQHPVSWEARCVGENRGTDEDVVYAAAREALIAACGQIIDRPVVYQEQQIPCGPGLPGCPCSGHVIRVVAGAPAEFPTGTRWARCDGGALALQPDGNLVLYGRDGQPVWATWTFGHSVARLVLQLDGNLVLYDPNENPVWSTGTFGHPGAFLAIQEDGNVVLYAKDNTVLWSTGTFSR